jgi:small-conductance mechanosensitive channel
MPDELLAWKGTFESAALILGGAAAGFAVYVLSMWILGRIARRTSGTWDERILERIAPPGRPLLPLIGLRLALPAAKLPPGIHGSIAHLTSLLLIATFAYLLIRVIGISRDLVLSKYDISRADNLSARKVHTQVRVMEKALISIVIVATLAFMLMTFDGIRQIGVSLLASAGIAGIILGFAAQKSLGTLLAGLQIALTQPIRVDDVVIVEGEWGRIEEINLTYVVVRIWDLRRLVVPIHYFIEKPFQNWTRSSSDLLGSVFLYLDYGTPIDALRREMDRVVKASPLWNGKTCVLQVTGCKESVVEVRLLVSSATASDSWDLRCHVREKMLDFLRETHPEGFPRVRAILTQPRGGVGSLTGSPAAATHSA